MRGELKLHVGCGSHVVDGWTNLDKSWNVYLTRAPWLRRALAHARVLTEEQAAADFPAGIVRTDIRHGLHFGDASARYVYTSHLIEHLSRWQALGFLRECHRVLAPRGTIRIATPDLRALVSEYTAGQAPYGPTPADSFVQQLETFREIEGSFAQRLIRRFVFAPHQWLYDDESLSHLLREAGFASPQVCRFREGLVPDLERLEHRSGSLFAEATRA